SSSWPLVQRHFSAACCALCLRNGFLPASGLSSPMFWLLLPPAWLLVSPRLLMIQKPAIFLCQWWPRALPAPCRLGRPWLRSYPRCLSRNGGAPSHLI